jgi:hypothetical protein
MESPSRCQATDSPTHCDSANDRDRGSCGEADRGANGASGASGRSCRGQGPAQNAGFHDRDNFRSGCNGSGVWDDGAGDLGPLADQLKRSLFIPLICAITLVV